MKSLKKVLILCLLLVSGVMLTSCNNKTESNYAYVVIETNPSVELVCNDKGIVVAINGLNDDGKLLILNEELINKNIEEVSKLIIELTMDMGYTVSGLSTSSQEILFSVSSNSLDLQASIEKKLTTNLNKAITDLDLDAKLLEPVAKSREYFEEIVLKHDPTLTKEEVKKISYVELMAIVYEATKEKSEFLTVALEEYYQRLKEYEFKLKYKQELVNSLSSKEQVLRNSYNQLLTQYNELLTQFKAEVAEFFTSPDSLYVKAINKYNEKKQEVMMLKVEIAAQKKANKSTIILETQLELSEQALAALDTMITTPDKAIKAAFDVAIKALERIYNQMVALEEQFPESIDFESQLTKAEDYINSSKDGLFEKFEEDFSKEKLNQIKNNLLSRKEALIQAVIEKRNSQNN